MTIKKENGLTERLRNTLVKTAENDSPILCPITLKTKVCGSHQELFLEDNTGSSFLIAKMELPSNVAISPHININVSDPIEVLKSSIAENLQNVVAAMKSCPESDNRPFTVRFGFSLVPHCDLVIGEEKVTK